MKIILVDAVEAFIIETKSGNFEIFEEMRRILDEFINKKIILTGADDDGFKKYGLDKMPYEVFTLKHNLEKTNPEYFKEFLKQHSLDIKDVVYFEHNQDAVKSAQSVGINTFYYDPEKKDLLALKDFLDKNI